MRFRNIVETGNQTIFLCALTRKLTGNCHTIKLSCMPRNLQVKLDSLYKYLGLMQTIHLPQVLQILHIIYNSKLNILVKVEYCISTVIQ